MPADPPAGIVGWLVIDDKGRPALRLDEAGAMQYAAERHGVVWPLVVWHDPAAGPASLKLPRSSTDGQPPDALPGRHPAPL